jgi:DNA mismatch repair protein MutS2
MVTLEFDRVREALAERAATNVGRERCLGLQPTGLETEIGVQLDRLEDALFGVHLNLGGITDIREVLQKLGDGQMVSGSDLLEVAYTLDSAMTLRRSVAQHSSGPLTVVAERIGSHVVLTRLILERLNRDGSVRDDATPKLRTIRRRLDPLRHEIRDRLTGLLDRFSDAVQDRLVTIRRERYVIPVKASFESQVQGIVVDTSSSQQTVFMEPASVVPLNNELSKLLIEEEQEVARILLELARLVSDEPGLWDTLDAVAELDLVAAKASLSREWNLSRPEISPRGEFTLEAMRHPLIEDCVPNDVRLDATHRLLLITGPNMGGKTVTLKSLGLACVMMQCGLYVCASRARLPVLTDILLDVGDEQSISESLSTFAAHLKNIQRVLERASDETLVLIDELGSGTDPNEGAALSQAILEQLLKTGARGVVTSHLALLKVFASERQDVQNASMGFDLGRLAPTFKLMVGQPGRSYALAIAGRLGFPQSVISRAEIVLGPEGQGVERLLENLEREREKLELEGMLAREAREAAERDAVQYQARIQELERERDALMQRAREQAEALYKEAFEQVRQMKTRARDDYERPRVLNELRELRRASQAERPQASVVQRETDALKSGVTVEVPAYNATGTVVELRGDDVIVQMGLLKVTLKRRDVRLKRAAQVMTKTPISTSTSSFNREINLRGTGVEEALDEIRNFIIEAQALRESPIRILHGKGEGVLRRAVRDYLKTDKRVQSFHDAQPYEGGHGVTVAHLRI